MRKFRNIPALVTLLAGFVSSVVMIIQKYSLVHFLWVLVAVMAGFYMAGLLLRVILNKAFKDLETEEEKRQRMKVQQEKAKARRNRQKKNSRKKSNFPK